MPLTGQEPQCRDCKTDESDVWERTDSGEVLCDKCYEMQRIVGTYPASNMSHLGEKITRHTASVRSSADTTALQSDSFNQTNASFTLAKEADSRNSNLVTDRRQSNNGNQTSRLSSTGKDAFDSKMTRKSTRIKPSKSKSQTAVKAQATKGRSRRVIFKKKPVRAPTSSATVITSNHIFYKGFYWQVGDIVSVVDEEDGSLYYAQIRGFLQDPYNEKSAVITWLVPTALSPPIDFDASTYILGPEEDLPRKMEYFDFVCHAPSDYFHSRNAPYSLRSMTSEPGIVWTSLKAGSQPSFGSIASPDDFDYDSKFGNLNASKTETGRRVRDLNRKQLVNRDKKLGRRELQHF